MTMGWGSRAVRAAVFAAVCVLLAALGHVMMSGAPVPGWLLAVATVTTGATAWFLADRERGLPLVVSLAVGSQAVLHTAFSLTHAAGRGATSTGGMGGTGDTGGAGGMGAMGHAGMGGPLSVDSAHLRSMPMESMGANPLDHLLPAPFGTASSGMLAAHLLAALLCGVWLAHGERAAFRILRALGGWLVAPLRLPLLPPVPPHRPRVRVRRDHTVSRPRDLLLVHAITSRGPPAGTAVV
ncbi:hypothetical protein [Streptomyces cavernae]|uniref:hypothetical protein n=1 Tax=Streptomyces cavernae TaxID=2259034 RepID=UPI000FEBDD71|nr:hypothetical protein [Streptomyces cavernae]